MATPKTRPSPKLKAPPVKGPIPDRITYHLRPLTEMARGWDQSPGEPGVPVNPAFPTDADSPKVQETAAAWASRVDYKAVAPGPVYTVPNDPIAGVTLVSLELRGEGGRAWKVLVEPSADHPAGCVDLREGPLLETLITEGCDPGGVLRGTFVWARGGNSLRLVRVGSPVHAAMLEEMAALRTPPAEVEALIPGHAYRLPGKDRKVTIYLGRASTMRVTSTWKRGDGYTHTGAYVPSLHVWLDLYTHQNKAPDETLRNAVHGSGDAVGRAYLRSSARPVVEDLGDACGLLTNEERVDLLALLRRDAAESLNPAPLSPTNPHSRYTPTPLPIEKRLASYAERLYLRPWKGPLPAIDLPAALIAEITRLWSELNVVPR